MYLAGGDVVQNNNVVQDTDSPRRENVVPLLSDEINPRLSVARAKECYK